jgi:hypothetical protein
MNVLDDLSRFNRIVFVNGTKNFYNLSNNWQIVWDTQSPSIIDLQLTLFKWYFFNIDDEYSDFFHYSTNYLKRHNAKYINLHNTVLCFNSKKFLINK